MKKLLLSLAAMALGLSANAGSVTFDFKSSSYGLPAYDGQTADYVTVPATIQNGDVQIVLNGQLPENNCWRMWSDGLRAYSKGAPYFTVSTLNGENVTGVEWTVVSGCTFALLNTPDDNIAGWSGSEQEVSFLYTGAAPDADSSVNKAVITITVTYGDDTIDVPETPEVPTYPGGTISVAKALELIGQGYTGEATVAGYIIAISEVSTQYGNATYTIADDATATSGLVVFRGKYIGGESFTAEDQIKVGAQVVVKGELVNYNGTYEFTTGSTILSYEGAEGDDEPNDDPLEGSETATFNFADPTSLGVTIPADEEELTLVGQTLKSGVVSLSCDGEGANVPRLFYSSTANNPAWSFRFYNGNTVTISCEEGYVLTGIEFTQTNLGNSSITWSEGSFNGKTWLAGDKEVTSLEISKTASGNNPTITNMTVYYTKSTGVEEIATEVNNAPAVYYNLQGVRVNNPAKGGLYIIRQGDKTVKAVIR